MFGDGFFGGTTSSSGTATLSANDRLKLDSVPLPTSNDSTLYTKNQLDALFASKQNSLSSDTLSKLLSIPDVEMDGTSVQKLFKRSESLAQRTLTTEEVRKLSSVPVPDPSWTAAQGANVYSVADVDAFLRNYEVMVPFSFEVSNGPSSAVPGNAGTVLADTDIFRRKFVALNPSVDNARLLIGSQAGAPTNLPSTMNYAFSAWSRVTTQLYANATHENKTIRLVNVHSTRTVWISFHTVYSCTVFEGGSGTLYYATQSTIQHRYPTTEIDVGGVTYASLNRGTPDTITGYPAVNVTLYAIRPKTSLFVTYIGSDTYVLERNPNTALADYATTSALSDYATTSSLSNYALKNGVGVRRITLSSSSDSYPSPDHLGAWTILDSSADLQVVVVGVPNFPSASLPPNNSITYGPWTRTLPSNPPWTDNSTTGLPLNLYNSSSSRTILVKIQTTWQAVSTNGGATVNWVGGAIVNSNIDKNSSTTYTGTHSGMFPASTIDTYPIPPLAWMMIHYLENNTFSINIRQKDLSNRPVVTKTTDYTWTDADFNNIVVFNSGTANLTLTVPSTTTWPLAGAIMQLVNLSSTNYVALTWNLGSLVSSYGWTRIAPRGTGVIQKIGTNYFLSGDLIP